MAGDQYEAYRVGQKAVELAAAGQSGFMATILRDSGPIYSVRYQKVPLAEVANSERFFPKQWIATGGSDVTDDFVRYAKPLLGSELITLPTIDGRHTVDPLPADLCRAETAEIRSASRPSNMTDFTPKHDYLVGIDSDG